MADRHIALCRRKHAGARPQVPASGGVIRGWRWTFWLILVVILAGIVRGPTAVLQLAGILPSQSPGWYVVLQAVVGLLQFVIALVMLAGYRKHGVWGAF